MAHLCGIVVWAYRIRDRVELPKGNEHGWDDVALENAIEYCQALIEEGCVREPMDDFDLRDFIDWAKSELSPIQEAAA